MHFSINRVSSELGNGVGLYSPYNNVFITIPTA